MSRLNLTEIDAITMDVLEEVKSIKYQIKIKNEYYAIAEYTEGFFLIKGNYKDGWTQIKKIELNTIFYATMYLYKNEIYIFMDEYQIYIYKYNLSDEELTFINQIDRGNSGEFLTNLFDYKDYIYFAKGGNYFYKTKDFLDITDISSSIVNDEFFNISRLHCTCLLNNKIYFLGRTDSTIKKCISFDGLNFKSEFNFPYELIAGEEKYYTFIYPGISEKKEGFILGRIEYLPDLASTICKYKLYKLTNKGFEFIRDFFMPATENRFFEKFIYENDNIEAFWEEFKNRIIIGKAYVRRE